MYHSDDGNWNNQFFNIYHNESIEIKIPGMYLVSCNFVIKPASGVRGQFVSHFMVNRVLIAEGRKCQRGISSPLFTSSTSTLLNLEQKQTLVVHVTMTDNNKKRQSVQILISSPTTLIFIGDARSHPKF